LPEKIAPTSGRSRGYFFAAEVNSPHPQPFSLREKGAGAGFKVPLAEVEEVGFKVPLPEGEGFRVRAIWGEGYLTFHRHAVNEIIE
jgi:hypothetical protein